LNWLGISHCRTGGMRCDRRGRGRFLRSRRATSLRSARARSLASSGRAAVPSRSSSFVVTRGGETRGISAQRGARATCRGFCHSARGTHAPRRLPPRRWRADSRHRQPRRSGGGGGGGSRVELQRILKRAGLRVRATGQRIAYQPPYILIPQLRSKTPQPPTRAAPRHPLRHRHAHRAPRLLPRRPRPNPSTGIRRCTRRAP